MVTISRTEEIFAQVICRRIVVVLDQISAEEGMLVVLLIIDSAHHHRVVDETAIAVDDLAARVSRSG